MNQEYAVYEKALIAERQIKGMGYNTEQFVVKIMAPVVCRFDGEELSFENGKAVVAHQFDKQYIVNTVTIEDGKAVITLKDIPAPNVNWNGVEEVSFF